MKTIEELNKIRIDTKGKMDKALLSRHVLVCGGTGCISGGKLIDQFKVKIEAYKASATVTQTGCFGLCAKGPIVIVYPEGTFYQKVTLDDVQQIVEEHLIKGKPVDSLMATQKAEDGSNLAFYEYPFYKKQSRIALHNCGVIDPENIDQYIARDGYLAYPKAINMKQIEVIDWIKKSGLRGRGGGGFSTGTKWQFAHNAVNEQKYVVCNADEGDPGAFMDRSVLESDPHSVIEAMMIAGYAIGASKGVVYTRAEYPVAADRLLIALEQARNYGILGDNAMGLGHKFDIELRLGAGAFVCGEETALIKSVEGKRGEPIQRPPFPAVKGLFERPTLINNVETYANIPQIILNGPEWFAAMGTEKSKGTKVFALGGNINNTGLVEVPMGTTLRTIVEDIGGGIPNGKKFKAAQTGGPSGGCIPAQHLDVEIDYDNLLKLDSMMGSGGLIVMDETNCMVDIAKFYLEFILDESCGKCTPCRVGNKRLYEILEKITSGQATMEDLDKAEELAKYIKENSLCGLGQTAPNPMLSSMKYFREEYVAHVKDKTCSAKVCKGLAVYEVIEDKCIGCTMCKRACPTNAVSGSVKKVHHIDISKCIRCDACYQACKFGAISK